MKNTSFRDNLCSLMPLLSCQYPPAPVLACSQMTHAQVWYHENRCESKNGRRKVYRNLADWIT